MIQNMKNLHASPCREQKSRSVASAELEQDIKQNTGKKDNDEVIDHGDSPERGVDGLGTSEALRARPASPTDKATR
jgi:hypothetical protein